MTQKENEISLDLDLKEIERKVYMSYSEDGLIDIAIGLVFLGWGISLVIGPSGLIGILPLLGLAIWYLGKRYLTVPRIGMIVPNQKFENRTRNLTLFLLILGMLVLTVAIIGIANKGNLLAVYSLVLLGLVVAGGICVIALLLKANRLFIYAIALFVAFAGGDILDRYAADVDAFAASIILVSTLILLAGFVVLARFLRQYPLPEEEV